MRRRILVTGLPGCGKTTVVRRVAEILGDRASGFYTEEVRDALGRRTGFQVVSLDGKRGELADKGTGRGPRVGSYRVNVRDFERIALPSMDVGEGGILLIDEIGKMECHSEGFVRKIRLAFQAGHSLLATIPLRGGGPLIEEIRRRPDVETIPVTRGNRDALPARLAAMLSGPSSS